MASLEEATQCSRCSVPGEQVKLTEAPRDAKLPRGTKIALIYCRNNRCKWFNTPWTVQINPDGTIPEPQDHTGKPKIYQGFDHDNARAQELIATLKRNAEAELQPGAEIRRSH